MSTDIRKLAHSILNKSEYAGHAEHAAPKAPELKLPRHILQHAHEYISKIQMEKRKIQP